MLFYYYGRDKDNRYLNFLSDFRKYLLLKHVIFSLQLIKINEKINKVPFKTK